MRHELAKLAGLRIPVEAVVSSFDEIRRPQGMVSRVLLVQVRHGAGHLLTDHVWITPAGAFKKKFKSGDRVRFTALVRQYRKRLRDRIAIDYGLVEVKKVEKAQP